MSADDDSGWTPSAEPPLEERGLDIPDLAPDVEAQLVARLLSPDFREWSTTVSRVGFCAHPVRLVGRTDIFTKATGELVRSYSSSDEPAGVTYKRCGNRRASACESCSRQYAADTFHLIRAGVAGGKGVPASVGDTPLVFATLTAPSFGTVHGTRANAGRCRPRHDDGARCRHGRTSRCMTVHDQDDPAVGQPLCVDCYDYESQVVWQWWAPELWRRFTIALRRAVARHLGITAIDLADVASVQYAKVAEYQLRGAIHFHALIRLDGPKTPDGFAPAPTTVDAGALADFVQKAAAAVQFTAPPVHDRDAARVLAFGVQVDTRPVRTSRRTDDPERGLTPEQVAGYLAKYATKSATDTTTKNTTHLRRLHTTAGRLARHGAAGRPDASLGFRGHFATKSRRYSLTLGALRRARQRAQARIAEANRTGQHLDLRQLETELLADDQEDTTLVIGHWAYAGTGWANEGETALAVAAAARAREYAQERAQQKRTAAAQIGRKDRATESR